MTEVNLKLKASVVESNAQGGVVSVQTIVKTIEFPFVPVNGMIVKDGDEKITIHHIEFNLLDWDQVAKKITVTAGTDTVKHENLSNYLANDWELEE